MPQPARFRQVPLAVAVFAAMNFSPLAQAAGSVVISQVFGGGGNTGAPYQNDFVELFNRSAAAVNITGWSIQYASATGTGNFSSNGVTNLSGTLQPGQYYLVRLASNGAVGSALPATDATGSSNLSGSAGKVVLVNTSTGLACNGGSTACNATQTAQIVDLVGYGTANYFEGAAAPALTNSTAGLRKNGGCTDTDNNASDFAAGTPAPRNTATALNTCVSGGGTPTVSLSVSVNSGSEAGQTVVTVTATASAAVSGNQTVNLAVTGTGITSGDYTLSNSVITIPTGSTTGSVTFTVVDDSAVEGTETPVLTISNPSSGVALGAITTRNITIIDNDNLPCSAADTSIHAVQGSGAASPLANSSVTVQGVVVADFQGATRLDGYFLQEQFDDADSATSEGIFVYDPSNHLDVNVGDLVQVDGKVQEFNGLTEVSTVTKIEYCGTAAIPSPVSVTLPETTDGELERYEGMLVSFPAMTVQQNYFLGRYGQLTLGFGGRLPQPTNLYAAGSAEALARTDLNARSLLVLDDGSSSQNPSPIPYIGQDNTVRAGDQVANLVGALDFGPINSDTSIRDYRLHPTVTPSFTRTNLRTAAPDLVGGNVKVASANVLNYFTTLDAAGGKCYPTMTQADCRGANTAAELQRQADKLVAEILALNADVVGLMEIENNGSTAVGNLVSRLNTVAGAGTYAAVTDPLGYQNHSIYGSTDAIKPAVIYKPGVVTPIGVAEALNDPAFSLGRAPVAQTFELNASSARFTVVVNHFKSKGSCPTAGDVNADQGDGQGCWNELRVSQAQALLGFIASLKLSSGDNDVLVIGDLNSYGQEDPVQTLVTGGLTDQLAARIAQPYSYVFDGLAGYLDHALTSASLGAQVSGVTEWHNNADEPSVIDYNTEFKPQDLYTASPYRASDHDPVLIGLNLGRNEILGTANADNLVGTAAGDRLTGLSGNDTLTGGAGRDEFVFTSIRDAIDTVTDFTPGTDTLVLTGVLQGLGISSANPLTAGYVVCTASGTTAVISIDPDASGPAAKRALVALKNQSCAAVAAPTHYRF